MTIEATQPENDETSRFASVTLLGPDDGLVRRIELTGERLTIGRLPEANDLALEPDPQQLVTRQVHCLLERRSGRWFVDDNASVNGVFLRRGESLERVEGRSALVDGDVICLLALLPETGEPRYWQLSFADPLRTRPAGVVPRVACLSYDFPQAKLFLMVGVEQRAIDVRPQVHKLVRYMAGCNSRNAGVPVLCDHQELMRAVWGDEPLHTREELARLVWELRRELEPHGADDLVENERGLGYRLHSCA
jgi:hypothetical protein